VNTVNDNQQIKTDHSNHHANPSIDISNENWRSVLDPDKPASQLIPFLESFERQLTQLKQENESLKQRLREATKAHRGSVFTLHNKMFQKLLDTEEEHGNEVENKAKKLAELERKVQVYEQIDRGGDMNNNLQQFLAKEQEYLDRIHELERERKKAEDELKIEAMKTEESDRERRKSIATLHNRMFKRFLEAEEQSETTTTHLKKLVYKNWKEN